VTLDLHGYRTGSVSPEDAESGEDAVADVFDADYPSAE
jgi:tRNA-specific 2-thiouridylase/uncharacterized protein